VFTARYGLDHHTRITHVLQSVHTAALPCFITAGCQQQQLKFRQNNCNLLLWFLQRSINSRSASAGRELLNRVQRFCLRFHCTLVCLRLSFVQSSPPRALIYTIPSTPRHHIHPCRNVCQVVTETNFLTIGFWVLAFCNGTTWSRR